MCECDEPDTSPLPPAACQRRTWSRGLAHPTPHACCTSLDCKWRPAPDSVCRVIGLMQRSNTMMFYTLNSLPQWNKTLQTLSTCSQISWFKCYTKCWLTWLVANDLGKKSSTSLPFERVSPHPVIQAWREVVRSTPVLGRHTALTVSDTIKGDSQPETNLTGQQIDATFWRCSPVNVSGVFSFRRATSLIKESGSKPSWLITFSTVLAEVRLILDKRMSPARTLHNLGLEYLSNKVQLFIAVISFWKQAANDWSSSAHLSKQCAADRIQEWPMMEPPQTWRPWICRLTCHGQAPFTASVPPTMRVSGADELLPQSQCAEEKEWLSLTVYRRIHKLSKRPSPSHTARTPDSNDLNCS